MADRWRRELAKLDRVEVPTTFPHGRPAPDPLPPLRSRIVAGIVAIAVVIAGMGWFFVAYRTASDPPAAATPFAPAAELTVWPEGPLDGVGAAREVQLRVDEGDPEFAWRLDPGAVIERFQDEMWGWNDVAYSVFEHKDQARPGKAVFGVETRGCRGLESPCTELDAGFHLIELRQPIRVGEGGIWSVAAVFDRSVELPPEDATGMPAGAITFDWPNPYGRSEVAYGFESFDGCEQEGVSELAAGGTFDVDLPEPLADGARPDTCSHVAAAYAFAYAVEKPAEPTGEPYSEPSRVMDLTIIPFLYQRQLEPADPLDLTETYRDGLGWSIDYPKGWSVLPISWFDGRVSTTGAAFSNEPLVPATEAPGEGMAWPDQSKLSPDAVIVIVTHRDGGPAPTIGNDSSFPLEPGDSQAVPGGMRAARVLDFRGDGLEFNVQFGGFADAPLELLDVPDQMIRTIRFQPWELGDVRNGFTPILDDFHEGRAASGAVDRLGLIYVVKPTAGQTYVLDVAELNCEGANDDWDPRAQQILMESPCFPDVRYDLDGQPDPANPVGFQTIAQRHEVIRAWDGAALVSLR